MADPIYKNSESIGKDAADLILKTAGKVIIKVKDRYYQLNFKDKGSANAINTVIVDNEEEITNLIPDITKNTLFITKEGGLYLYISEETKLIKLGGSQSSTLTTFEDVAVNGDLTVLGNVYVTNDEMIKNLNAQYLEGKRASDFLQNGVDNTIKGTWTFNDPVNIKKILGINNNYIDLSSGVLNIDTIRCSKLISDDCTCSNDLGDSDASDSPSIIEDESAKNTLIDSINAKTYIDNTPRIIDVQSLGISNVDDIKVRENWEIVIYGKNQYGIVGTGVPGTDYELLNSLFTFTELDENGNPIEIEVDEDYRIELKDCTSTIKESSNWDNWTVNDISLREFVSQNTFDKSILDPGKSYFTYELDLTFNDFDVNDNILIESVDGLVDFTVYNVNDKKIWILTEDDCPDKGGGDVVVDCIYNKDPFKYGIVLKNEFPNIIGNLNNSTNTFFGPLSGWGLSMENNCYLLNPEIALQKNNVNYLLISNTRQTFIGLSNYGHFLELDSNGYGSIKSDNITISNNTFGIWTPTFTLYSDWSGSIGPNFKWDSDGNITYKSDYHEVLWEGIVENGVMIKQKDILGLGKMTVSRLDKGIYEMIFPLGTNVNINQYTVMLTGWSYGGTDSEHGYGPLYATLYRKYPSGFIIYTSDDETTNDGGFTFQVIDTSTWS